MDMFLQKHIYLRLRKKTGRPLGLFSVLQIFAQSIDKL